VRQHFDKFEDYGDRHSSLTAPRIVKFCDLVSFNVDLKVAVRVKRAITDLCTKFEFSTASVLSYKPRRHTVTLASDLSTA